MPLGDLKRTDGETPLGLSRLQVQVERLRAKGCFRALFCCSLKYFTDMLNAFRRCTAAL